MSKYFLGWNGIRGTYIKPIVYLLLVVIIIPIIAFIYLQNNFPDSTFFLSRQEKDFVRIVSHEQGKEFISNRGSAIYWLFVILIVSTPVLIIFYALANPDKFFVLFLSKSFYCKNCLKSIVPGNIQNFDCPNCHSTKRNGIDLIFFCRNCKDVIHKFSCPHCKSTINLIEVYNKSSILNQRYEK